MKINMAATFWILLSTLEPVGSKSGVTAAIRAMVIARMTIAMLTTHGQRRHLESVFIFKWLFYRLACCLYFIVFLTGILNGI